MNFCEMFGHMKHNPDNYARFSPNFHAVDGIGRHHRVIEYQCDRCYGWVKLCMIHTTALEGDKDGRNHVTSSK